MKNTRTLPLLLALLIPLRTSAIIDLDKDGWSDLWEAAYGSGFLPDEDSDGDGRTNRQEHDEGTDPLDNLSKKPEPAFEALAKGKLRFTWPTVIGKSYQLEVSFDGANWADVGAPVSGTGELVERIIDKNTTFLGTGPKLSRYTNLPDEPLIQVVKDKVKEKVTPAEERNLPKVETPPSDPNLDHYGQYIRGWIMPPANGTYVFWIAGNFASEFSLSTNTTPQKKKRLAYSDDSNNFHQYEEFPETQKSVPVVLKAGKLYYFEVYQQETTGSDHVSLAWTGPGLNPVREEVDGAYVTDSTETLGRKMAKGTPTWRLNVSDRDSDGDGLTDHEELTVGLDPLNSRSVSRTADLTTLTAMFSATNSVTVGAETARGYEAGQVPARFTFFRTGNVNPISVHFTVEGTAQMGQDYAPLSGTVEFGVGQTSAIVELRPESDSLFEPAETVTARVTADAAYELGSPNSATVTIDDAADVVYVATLRSNDKIAGAYGSAGLNVSGNKAFSDLTLSFGHLTSEPTSVDIVVVQPNGTKVSVLNLPLNQVGFYHWTFDAAGGLTRDQILAALDQGKLGVRVATQRYPDGELNALFVKNWGWKEMQKPPKPGPALTRARNDGEAARFLNQATFGATPGDIKQVRKLGYASWLDGQFKKPPTKHLPYVEKRSNELTIRDGNDGFQRPRQEAWWQAALDAPDQVRQRMAFALSQILVISDVGVLENEHKGVTNYYDILVKHSFGNFRDLLEEVTLSPMMGQYLSMARNQKPNPNTGSEPDENYAREIMQLFTIGLNMLNTDGSLALDANGLPVASYTQNDIVGLAHIFTGWGSWFDPATPPANRSNFFRFDGIDPIRSMISYPEFHDTKAKKIVRGVSVPANLDGPAELKVALDTLFNHPNVGPFIARQLIQRFVTSNPSRGYVYRVASKFNNNGNGKRGDLKATLRAVLLDPEARNPVFADHISHGKLREPLLRVSALLRGFRSPPPILPDQRYFIDLSNTMSYESPVKSPTVFNFFQPGYLPPGELSVLGLFGPEFQITQETTVIDQSNHVYSLIRNGINTGEEDANGDAAIVRLDLTPYIALLDRTEKDAATNQSEMVESLNALLLDGQMTAGLGQSIRTAVAAITGDSADRQRDRVRVAVYLIAVSPEFAVQK